MTLPRERSWLFKDAVFTVVGEREEVYDADTGDADVGSAVYVRESIVSRPSSLRKREGGMDKQGNSNTVRN